MILLTWVQVCLILKNKFVTLYDITKQDIKVAELKVYQYWYLCFSQDGQYLALLSSMELL